MKSHPTPFRLLVTRGRRCLHTLYTQTAPLLTSSSCSHKLLRSPRKPARKISKIPFKVLDAPELQDDFYLNLVDWSAGNLLSVGLGACVYLWSACTSQVILKTLVIAAVDRCVSFARENVQNFHRRSRGCATCLWMGILLRRCVGMRG